MDDVRMAITEGRNVKVPRLAKQVGTGVNALYAAIARGEIKTVRVGRAILVPPQEAGRLLGMETAP